MDDVILCMYITVGLFVSGLYMYCNKTACSPETKKYYIYAVLLTVYVTNIFYIMKHFKHYNYNSLKIALLLIIIPIVLYQWKCFQHCDNLFIIIFPSVMVIFNLYVYLFQ